MTPRIPPQAVDMERAVIGACLLGDSEAIGEALEILSPGDFYLERHQLIWEALRGLVAASQPVDLLTLAEALKSVGRLSLAGGEAYLMDLSAEIVSSANVAAHASIVKDKAILRQAISHASTVLEAAYVDGARAADVLPKLEDAAFRLAGQDNRKGLESMRTVLQRTAVQLEAAARGELTGVRTGFADLDRVILGLRPGTLNILAARPGMGKTALALDIAEQCGEPVAFFSLEMASEEMAERMLSKATGLDSTALRNGNAMKSSAATLQKAFADLAKSRIYLDDSAKKSPLQVISQCKRMKAKEGLGLIIVDYLQFMSLEGKSESKRHELEDVSKLMKACAKELGVPVLALAQLSRDCEKRDDKRPILADLRESGQIEQDAHLVMFIYRDEVYHQDAEPGKAELLIRKNRSGPTGFVKLTWVGTQTRFLNYTAASAPPSRNYRNGGWDD